MSNCALIIDTMAIKKQIIIWDNSKGKFVGYADYGRLIDPEEESPANEC